MLAKYLDFETLFLNTNILTITTIAKPPHKILNITVAGKCGCVCII